MRIKLVSKDSVIVDCRGAVEGGRRWTLVDNKTGQAEDFQTVREIASRLCDDADAKAYIDEVAGIRAREAEEDAKYKSRAFFADRGAAPALLNLLDASDHVVRWEVGKTNDTLANGIVRIDYKSDQQLLFQEGGNAVFRYPADNGKETGTAKEQTQGL